MLRPMRISFAPCWGIFQKNISQICITFYSIQCDVLCVVSNTRKNQSVISSFYFIEDEDSATPEESASNQLLKEQVQGVLGTLSDREQKIIRMRFGLDNGKSHTLEEVGQEFAVTRERIRQIEAKALAKLRKHKDAKKLYEYLQ